MDNATALDLTIIVAVVGLRLLVPLLIPVVPLPAIIAALVIDAADQTIFQTQLTPAFWHDIEDGYQGYDKSLDIYYLTMAYVATLKNWTNVFAVETGRFLWYYRLFGVTLFEVLRHGDGPESWRWLLLVFPNTFEYFFIAYEAIRLRWDPRRLSRRFVVLMAAFIWIFIKLPQEYWIHVAQLDFTDFADEHSWVYPTLAVLVVVLLVGGWYLITRVLPAKDWGFHLIADTPPPDREYEAQRIWGRPLVEKCALLALICIIFSEVLPDANVHPLNVAIGAAIFVVVDSAYGLALSMRDRTWGVTALLFVGLVVTNLVVVEVLHLLTSRFEVPHALFFALLLSLVVSLFDRYRPHFERRQYEDRHTEPDAVGAPA